MITTNQDLYDVVRNIVDALQRAGEVELAADLGGALSISSLPGEILGETQLQLERVRASRISDRIDVRKAVDEAVRYIKSALGRRGDPV